MFAPKSVILDTPRSLGSVLKCEGEKEQGRLIHQVSALDVGSFSKPPNKMEVECRFGRRGFVVSVLDYL